MRLGVREGERASPRAAPDEPALDPEVDPQQFDVRDQVLRRVGRQVDVGLARVRRAATAVALIEENDEVLRRIEERPVPRCTPGAGASVEDERGLADRDAIRLEGDEVAVPDVQDAARKIALMIGWRHRPTGWP